MANNFELFFQRVLKDEGTRFEDVPGDNGGPTCCGITIADVARWNGVKLPKRDAKGWDDLSNKVRALNPATAMEIYKKFYWDEVRADELPPGVDYCVVDYAVNSGSGKAIRTLAAIVGTSDTSTVSNATLAAIQTYASVSSLIQHFQDDRRAYLETIARASHNRQFRNGWLAREDRVRLLSMKLAENATATKPPATLPKAIEAPPVIASDPVPSKAAVAMQSKSFWSGIGAIVSMIVAGFQSAADYIAGIGSQMIEKLPDILSDTKGHVSAFTDLAQTVGVGTHVAKAATVAGIVFALVAIVRHVNYKQQTLTKGPQP